MAEMEEKLNAILNNPQMMQNILSMAQSLGQSGTPSQPKEDPPSIPDFAPAILKSLSGIATQNTIDPQQRALLRALSPYVHKNRIVKLERAMRAAKIAKLASGFLNAGGLQLLTGR